LREAQQIFEQTIKSSGSPVTTQRRITTTGTVDHGVPLTFKTKIAQSFSLKDGVALAGTTTTGSSLFKASSTTAGEYQ